MQASLLCFALGSSAVLLTMLPCTSVLLDVGGITQKGVDIIIKNPSVQN